MSLIKDILRDERDRLVLLKNHIEEQISSLPKGSISRKKRSSHLYCYLAYRQGKRVIFKYIGKDNSPEIDSIEKDIKKRRKLEKRLREIKADLKDIKRGLGER